MNKSEIIDLIAQAVDIPKAKATQAFDTAIDAITNALAKGDMVPLTGFGTFVVRERSARKGRNPRTGEVIEIKANKTAAFKPGKVLKTAVQDGKIG